MKVCPHPILHLPDRPTPTDCTAHAAREAGNTVRLEPKVYVPNSTTPFEGNLAGPKFPHTNAYPVGSIHSIPKIHPKRLARC